MKTVHAGDAIDKSRFNMFHLLLIFWGFFIILVDGYDVVIYGSIVPSLIEEWSISSVTAGAIGSYTVMGTVVGAVFFGYLADKVGRKKIILFCTALFSLFTALSGVADGPVLFTIFRVISGIGLGGVMPNVIALTTEYAPKKIRSALISFVFCGYSVGAIAAALASRAILPEFGWRPIFWIAGLPLLILPFIAKAIPESAVFLLEKRKNEEVKRILKKVNPELSLNGETEFERTEAPEQGSTIVKLF